MSSVSTRCTSKPSAQADAVHPETPFAFPNRNHFSRILELCI